jgi:Protein kinase domain
MSAPITLQPGQKVGSERFALIRELGRGGMGEVWLAQDERLQEPVALKFLPPELRADPVALDDLRRETARSHRLTHANIVRIHDLHEEAGGPAFIAMEYVAGPNLAALRLEQPGRVISWDFLKPLIQQLCPALDYAHSEKVIHRDLKPGNIMVDGKGRLKLADFGIAATVSDSVSRVSGRHATSGTLPYMSPQQLSGKRPSAADDIYALGATLYELLTSKPPFYTGDLTHQVLHEPAEPLDERLAGLELANPVPPDAAALIMACLAKEPTQRPQSARAVAEWIGLEITPKPSTESLERAMFAQEGSGQESTAVEPPAVSVPPRDQGKWKLPLLLTGAVAALVLAGTGVWYAVRHRDGSGETKSPATSAEATTAGVAREAAGQRPSGLQSPNPASTGPAAIGTFELANRPSVPFISTLADTIWLAKDSNGDSYCFQFLANGLLNYEAGRGIHSGGTWEANGDRVNLDINQGYASLSGTISGRKMAGDGHSRNGQTWTWEATPKQ